MTDGAPGGGIVPIVTAGLGLLATAYVAKTALDIVKETAKQSKGKKNKTLTSSNIGSRSERVIRNIL